jgi:4'-phosphopantetheinyl transferase
MRQEDVQNQVEKFYEVWTKKEAFLKYTGLGLAGRLSKLDVLEQKYIYRKYEWYGKLYAIAVYSEHLGEFSWKFVNSIRD